VLGQVGDSGNSDQPHLHLQVPDKPTFDVENRDIHTFSVLFDRATVPDPHRGDTVQPAAP
jgi:murein DD-endopeptidase MepM/ murein hydrolase activator NlpD